MFIRHLLLAFICATGLLLESSAAQADQVSWQEKRGSLAKPGFSKNTATHSIPSDSGNNKLTLKLAHEATSRDLFSFSKWEIDRWGDPNGELTAESGSWQVTSNQANDTVLGLWGYWGWDGAADSPKVRPDETTTYTLSIIFEQPVTSLTLPVHGMNALFTSQHNTNDELRAEGFFGQTQVQGLRFESLGASVKRHGPGIKGKSSHPIGSNSNTYDEGSAIIVATEPIDRVVLTFTQRAQTPSTAPFNDGQQPWSFSLGNIGFENQPPDSQNTTAIEWLPRKGQLSKPGFTRDKASTQVLSNDGRVSVNLSVEHDLTTSNLTTYSKWEIDRWGDPTGELFSPGSWQIVTDAANSVVLGLWGYWGAPGETTAIGDFTCYQVILDFEYPVRDLRLPLHGINGFLKPSNGYNSGDELMITASLEGQTASGPSYTDLGPAVQLVGDRLVGNYEHQIDDGISGQHMSDDGSCKALFSDPVDRVTITLINRAGHLDPALFQNGVQTWSMAIGDLTFSHEAPELTNLSRQANSSVTQSSTLHPHTSADLLTDGNTNGNLWDQQVSHTGFEENPWIVIDLGAHHPLRELRLWERTDNLATSLDDLVLFVSDTPFTNLSLEATEALPGVTTQRNLSSTQSLNLSGRYLKLQRQGLGALSFAEIEVLGPSTETTLMIEQSPSTPSSGSANSPSPNPLLDQLGHFALVTRTFPAGLDIAKTESGVDLLFQRPVGLDTLLSYTLELSKDLITWNPITIEMSPLETLRLENIDTYLPNLRDRGFARLRIHEPAVGNTSLTKAVGWYETASHPGYQTHGLSLNRAPIGAGHILSIDAPLKVVVSTNLDLSEINPAYLEILDGSHEGHRLELQAITNNNDGTALVECSSIGSTINQLTEDLVGAAVTIRPHWTLDAAYPASQANPEQDPASAGQVLVFQDGRYHSFYSLAHPEGAYWTPLGVSSLPNSGLETIAPGRGVFLCHAQAGTITTVGHVRDNAFRQPLAEGHHLIASAYPIPQSPADRALDQEHGFQSSNDPSLSDTLQIWSGDSDPSAEAFQSFFYFGATQSSSSWVASTDTNLSPQNQAKLFKPNRAAFVQVQSPRPLYQINLTSPNQ